MKSLFESILKKGNIVKILGVVITALGIGVTYLGGSIESDAEKGLITLDKQVLK